MTILHIYVYRFKTQDRESNDYILEYSTERVLECLQDSGQFRQNPVQTEQNQRNKYHQIFRLKEVYLLAIFILTYVGVGGTISGKHKSQRF